MTKEEIVQVKDRMIRSLARKLPIKHVLHKNYRSSALILHNRIFIDLFLEEVTDSSLLFKLKSGNLFLQQCRYYPKYHKLIPSFRSIADIHEDVMHTKITYTRWFVAFDFNLTSLTLACYDKQKDISPFSFYMVQNVNMLDYAESNSFEQVVTNWESIKREVIDNAIKVAYTLQTQVFKEFKKKQVMLFIPRINYLKYMKIYLRKIVSGKYSFDDLNNMLWYISYLTYHDILCMLTRQHQRYIMVPVSEFKSDHLPFETMEYNKQSRLIKFDDGTTYLIHKDFIPALNILASIFPQVYEYRYKHRDRCHLDSKQVWLKAIDVDPEFYRMFSKMLEDKWFLDIHEWLNWLDAEVK